MFQKIWCFVVEFFFSVFAEPWPRWGVDQVVVSIASLEANSMSDISVSLKVKSESDSLSLSVACPLVVMSSERLVLSARASSTASVTLLTRSSSVSPLSSVLCKILVLLGYYFYFSVLPLPFFRCQFLLWAFFCNRLNEQK